MIDSSNVFLYHKTTQRETYNKEYKKAKAEGFYDILFFNENNEVTEGAISNVFIEKNGILYTPPIECGLLKGVYRKKMMNKRNVIEKILYKKDIFEADNVFLCNSVRGLQKIKQ